MSNDIRICYRGEHYWREVLGDWVVNPSRELYFYGWYVDMPDGSLYDDGTGEVMYGYREFGPFDSLREAYDYAVPPEDSWQ